MLKEANGNWKLNRIIWIIVNYARLNDEAFMNGVPKDLLFEHVRKYMGELLGMNDFEKMLNDMKISGDIDIINENDEQIVLIPHDTIICGSYYEFYATHRKEIEKKLERLLSND